MHSFTYVGKLDWFALHLSSFGLTSRHLSSRNLTPLLSCIFLRQHPSRAGLPRPTELYPAAYVRLRSYNVSLS